MSLTLKQREGDSRADTAVNLQCPVQFLTTTHLDDGFSEVLMKDILLCVPELQSVAVVVNQWEVSWELSRCNQINQGCWEGLV